MVATARDPRALADLEGRACVVRLDVTDPVQVDEAVRRGVAEVGSLDVVVNNAGYSLIGAFEHIDDDEVRDQLETNLLGPWRVTRAVLPDLRRQGSGTIVNVSSQGGFAAYAGTSAYSASKFALEGMSEALAAEVAAFGIRVLVVEPGAYRTSARVALRTPARRPADDPYPDYGGELRAAHGTQPGDPAEAAAAIIAAVSSDDPPFRLVLGADARRTVAAKVEEVRADLDHCQRLF